MNKYNPKLKAFVNSNYKDYSGDLFSVFMYRNLQLCEPGGYCGFMTPFVWMFIKSYEKLHRYILDNKAITTLVQMEYSAFEEATVPICSFVLQNQKSAQLALCFRLSDFKGGTEVQKQKVLEAIANPDCGYFYEAQQDNFAKIPGAPVAYWVGERFIRAFEEGIPLNRIATVFEGLKTRDKERFVRLWHEISTPKWRPYAKGGAFRRWYGNLEYVVRWGECGEEIRTFKKSSGSNFPYFNTPTVTYGALTSYKFSGRYIDNAFFGGGGGGITNTDIIWLILGYVNSTPYHYIMNTISPTLNFEVGQIGLQPLILCKESKPNIEKITRECVSLSKKDWDSFEASWDFRQHPLM